MENTRYVHYSRPLRVVSYFTLCGGFPITYLSRPVSRRGEDEIDFSKQKWRLYSLIMGTSVHRLDSGAVMTSMTESVLKQKHCSVVVAGWKAGYSGRKVVRPGDAYILCITKIRLCREYSDQTVFRTRVSVH